MANIVAVPSLEMQRAMVERFAQTEEGKALRREWETAGGGEKFWMVADIGQPLWKQYIYLFPQQLAKDERVKWVRDPKRPELVYPQIPPGQRLDVVRKALAGIAPQIQKDPNLARQLEAKTPALMRFGVDVVASPSMYFGLTPFMMGMRKVMPWVGRFAFGVGEKVAARLPEGTRLFLSRLFIRPWERVQDAEIKRLLYEFSDRSQAAVDITAPAVKRTRRLIKGYSSAERLRAANLAARYETQEAARAAGERFSRREGELLDRLRQEAKGAWVRRPRMTMEPGREFSIWRPAEEVLPSERDISLRLKMGRGERLPRFIETQRGRVEMKPGARPGELLAREEVPAMRPVRRGLAPGEAIVEPQAPLPGMPPAPKTMTPELFARQQRSFTPIRDERGVVQYWVRGNEVWRPYRTGYMRLERPLQEEAGLRLFEIEPTEVARIRPGRPSELRPRVIREPMEFATKKEVEASLATTLARGAGLSRELQGMRETLLWAMQRNEFLARTGYNPVIVRNQLDVLEMLQKGLGAREVEGGLRMAAGVWNFMGKKVFTLYNPAFFVKNGVDTILFKNGVAGVPMHEWLKPVRGVDVFGRPMSFGRTLVKSEIEKAGWLARIASAEEGFGRQKLGEWVYYNTKREAGETAGEWHLRALARAREIVRQFHFNYDDISLWDKGVKVLFPFYAYQSNQLRWVIQTGIQFPRGARAYAALMASGEMGRGPEVRVPGLPTLMVQPFSTLSPARYMETVVGLLWKSEAEKERWRRLPLGAKVDMVLREAGFFAHPFIEQGLSALSRTGIDLMDDRSWKQVAPMVDILAKQVGMEATWMGVWQAFFPEYQGRPPLAEMKEAFNRRVIQRMAFSYLDGRPWTGEQAQKYVEREMQVMGIFAFFGMYPKVREKNYDRMKEMERRYETYTYAEKEETRRENRALHLWLRSKEK